MRPPEQIATGDKAAHKLLDYAPTYFVPANMPAGQTAQTFAQTQQQMFAMANGYLLTGSGDAWPESGGQEGLRLRPMRHSRRPS